MSGFSLLLRKTLWGKRRGCENLGDFVKVVGAIPARYASSRFPGKPLHRIAGKPLLQWVVEAVKKSNLIDEVIVATDSGEIFTLAESLGVQVAMTDPELPSGTDRIYAATLNLNADIIVNIQGDEPLLEPSFLEQLVEPLLKDSTLEMATVATLIQPNELQNPNVVKVVKNSDSKAIYFSRFAIPYSRNDAKLPVLGCEKHIGLYAYRKNFLEKFCRTSPTLLEKAESLEQLRALDMGAKIKVISIDCHMHGVDTPEDVPRVEEALKNRRNNGS